MRWDPIMSHLESFIPPSKWSRAETVHEMTYTFKAFVWRARVAAGRLVGKPLQ